MHKWINFCNIKKFNLNNKSLVVNFTSRLFLDNNVDESLLIGKKVYLAPPVLDYPREFAIVHFSRHSNNTCELIVDAKNFDGKYNLEDALGKNLFVSIEDFNEIFPCAKNNLEDIIGKQIFVTNNRNLGTVKDIRGSNFQNYLVVKSGNDEYLIPYVNEFIENEDEHSICFDLPEGLLDINK